MNEIDYKQIIIDLGKLEDKIQGKRNPEMYLTKYEKAAFNTGLDIACKIVDDYRETIKKLSQDKK